MRKRWLVLAGLLAAAAVDLRSQTASETIEVRVTNVDVVVTDRSGHPIHDLTRDDFELYENRKLQPITNLYEIRGDEVPASAPSSTAGTSAEASPAPAVIPAEMRQRSIVVFIDNTSIDPLRRNQALDATVHALDTIMRPGDDAMIITWDRRSKIVQPFTTDVSAVKRALENARKLTASVSTISWQKDAVASYANDMLNEVASGRMTVANAYSQSVGKARDYAEWLRATERFLLRSLADATSMLSGLEGKKLIIFVGGELQERPGLDVFMTVDSLFIGLIRGPTPAVIRESDLNMTDDLQKFARAANGNSVTMYMIDVADRSRSAERGSLQHMPDKEIEFSDQVNSYMSMAMLASSTGGTVLSGSTNFALALDDISRDLGSYYSLGYKPPANGGTDRNIAVKVKRPGVIVRSRHGSTLKTADEQMHDRVVANAFHSSLRSDFPLTIDVAPPEPFENGLFKVKVTLTFPSDLTYLPDGDNLAAEYEVYFVTADDDASLSPVGKQVHQVKFPASAAAAVKLKPLMHGTALIVKAGSQSISVALVDRYSGRTGYARATVTAQ
jgi:VWFA-related protein